MSRYTDQVGSVIKRVLQVEISGGLTDPRIKGIVTITRVEVAADLRDATVWCSVHPWEHASRTMHGLQAAKGHLRSKLSKAANMKRIPKIWLRLDKSLHAQSEVLGLIAKAKVQSNSPSRLESDGLNKGEDVS